MSNIEEHVEIIVPIFNEVKFIEQTINSLLLQTYRNKSITILDNCSNDGSSELIAQKYADKLRHIVHPKNLGAEKNFDLCIDYASGDYTCIFHGDDVYSRDIIEKQVDFLRKHTDVGAVFCLAKYINEKGQVISTQNLNFKDFNEKYDVFEILNLILKKSNFLICPSLMIRTDILKNLKSFDWFFRSSADLEMWLRVSEQHKIGIIKEYLIDYRISRKQWSEKERKRTSRADFFIVTDYYIKKYNSHISNSSLNGYCYLKIKDIFTRLKNCKNIRKKNKLFKIFILNLSLYKCPIYMKIFLFVIFCLAYFY